MIYYLSSSYFSTHRSRALLGSTIRRRDYNHGGQRDSHLPSPVHLQEHGKDLRSRTSLVAEMVQESHQHPHPTDPPYTPLTVHRIRYSGQRSFWKGTRYLLRAQLAARHSRTTQPMQVIRHQGSQRSGETYSLETCTQERTTVSSPPKASNEKVEAFLVNRPQDAHSNDPIVRRLPAV